MQEIKREANMETLVLKYDKELTERMVKESQEIGRRMEKLDFFINTHAATNPVSDMYLKKCEKQYQLMAEYREVLEERIKIMSAMCLAADQSR